MLDEYVLVNGKTRKKLNGGKKNLKGELKKQNNLHSTLAMQIPSENHRENIMKYIVYRHTGMHVHITKSINLKAITKKWGEILQFRNQSNVLECFPDT